MVYVKFLSFKKFHIIDIILLESLSIAGFHESGNTSRCNNCVADGVIVVAYCIICVIVFLTVKNLVRAHDHGDKGIPTT